jgi:hypothetical protein
MYPVLRSSSHPCLVHSKEPMTSPFPEPYQSSTLFSSQFFLTLFPHPCLCLVRCLYPFRFWDKSLYAFLISSMRAACSVLSHYLITLFNKEYTLKVLQFVFFSSFLLLLSPEVKIFCALPSSCTPSVFLYCESWGVIHITRWLCGESHPYKNSPCNCSFCVF